MERALLALNSYAALVARLYTAANAIASGLVATLHVLLDTGCRKGEALAATEVGKFTWSGL